MPLKLPRGPTTNLLAALITLAYIPVHFAGETDRAALLVGFVPQRIMGLASLNIDVDVPWLPVWITPLTATLVHADWMHLVFNILMLLFCGRYVEQLLGSSRTVIIYFVAAYAAACGQWISTIIAGPAPDTIVPMIGASGAVSGLLGTYSLIYSQRSVKPIGPVPEHVVRLVWLALAWTGIQLLVAFAGGYSDLFGGVAIGAHIGGFLAGLLLTRPLLARRFRPLP